MLLCQRTHKTHSNYHVVAVELPFIPKVIDCMQQTIKTYLEREHNIPLSVTRMLYVYQVCHSVKPMTNDDKNRPPDNVSGDKNQSCVIEKIGGLLSADFCRPTKNICQHV